jgi:protein phosphatase
MKLRTAALTHIGRVREENEDRFLCDDRLRLYAVADGIGGLPAGAQAAQLAVNALSEEVRALPADAEPDWPRIVGVVNDRVFKLGRIIDGNTGIGSTLTFVQFRDGELHLGHVGDSTCFRLRDGRLEKLTHDHNVENEMRLRAPEGQRVHLSAREGQALTRCIGQPVPLVADVTILPVAAGDRFLLCSDGVTRILTDDRLKHLLADSPTPEQLMQDCVDSANHGGGFDNATGVAIFIDAV